MFSLQFLQPFLVLHLSANRLRAPKQKPVNSPISNCDLLLEQNHYGANKQHAPQTCCIPGLDFGWSHLLHVEFLQLIQRGLGVQPCRRQKLISQYEIQVKNCHCAKENWLTEPSLVSLYYIVAPPTVWFSFHCPALPPDLVPKTWLFWDQTHELPVQLGMRNAKSVVTNVSFIYN